MPPPVDLTQINGQGIAARATAVAADMAGKPYIWGGKTQEGFDCSGFVSYVLIGLYPNAGAHFAMNVAGYISSDMFDDVAEADYVAGDIVIFPAINGSPNHIGIVHDANHWIGAQSSTGVAKVKFTNSYWGSRPRKFRRLRPIAPASVLLGRGASASSLLA